MQTDRANPVRDLDFYDAKGAVEAALESIGVTHIAFEPVEVTHLRAGQTAAITVGGEVVGYLGRLSDEIAASYKFRQPVFIADLNLQTILAMPSQRIAYEQLGKYPGIVRDVSFIVPRTVSYADIREAIIEQEFEICRNIMFVDVYEGQGMAEHERSVTVRIEYRSDERTLIEDEVESMHARILSQVQHRLGITVRY
jgi:phenylalanyl-tRNA synthetase beta chain